MMEATFPWQPAGAHTGASRWNLGRMTQPKHPLFTEGNRVCHREGRCLKKYQIQHSFVPEILVMENGFISRGGTIPLFYFSYSYPHARNT
jgi:hypothetical protein